MIVDCHVNIFEPRHVVATAHQQSNRRKMGTTGEYGFKADADTIYEAMKDVDTAILFTLRYGDSMGVEGDDETTAAAVTKYPDKFFGFAYVDPRRDDYMDLLVHAVEDLGLRGVKFGPIYNRVSVDDPRMTPVYDYLTKHDVPITMHMGTTYIADCPMEYGRPINVEKVTARYPDLKIVLAHIGHPWYDECCVLIRKQHNVYGDISGQFHRKWRAYNLYITAQEYRVLDKFFFGSDFPIFTVEETIEGLRAVNDIVDGTKLPRISEEAIEQIIHANPFEHWWHDDPRIHHPTVRSNC